jgi:hypothetical protein
MTRASGGHGLLELESGTVSLPFGSPLMCGLTDCLGGLTTCSSQIGFYETKLERVQYTGIYKPRSHELLVDGFLGA